MASIAFVIWELFTYQLGIPTCMPDFSSFDSSSMGSKSETNHFTRIMLITLNMREELRFYRYFDIFANMNVYQIIMLKYFMTITLSEIGISIITQYSVHSTISSLFADVPRIVLCYVT